MEHLDYKNLLIGLAEVGGYFEVTPKTDKEYLIVYKRLNSMRTYYGNKWNMVLQLRRFGDRIRVTRIG